MRIPTQANQKLEYLIWKKNPMWLLPADPSLKLSIIDLVHMWTDETNSSPLFSDLSSLVLKSAKALERKCPSIVV